MTSDSSHPGIGNHREFASTRWSMVRAVGSQDSQVAKSALQELCAVYWYPLYAYVRRQGIESNTAADVTQAFFADLLVREDIKRVDPDLGRFRSFLLVACKNFLKNEWKKQSTQKRGGGRQVVSFEARDAESRYQTMPANSETPDQAFEKHWALTMLERVNQQLRKEFESRGKAVHFDILHEFMAGKNQYSTLAEAAAKLDMSEVAAKVAVHRMRQRFGELLRDEISQTVDDPTQIDGEIAHLFEVLRK